MNKKKIVVADDEEDILYFIKYFLENCGYEVETSINGKGLTERRRDESPDLYLLDISMSGIDGRDICRAIKDNKSTYDIPVIIVSAHPDVKRIAEECGAQSFIAKPFEISDLLNEVKKQLKPA
jgi:DNA-binding response OmpR family regulator